MTFDPYADEAATMRLGGLTVENRVDRVSLHGSLDLTRDRTGLEHAHRLRALLEAIVAALEHDGEGLPQQIAKGETADSVRNPFA